MNNKYSNMTFLDNKYSRWYDQLIEKARAENNDLPSSVYTEVHHILPKCIGGSDDASNLVRLTGKQHFFAHAILIKMKEPNTGDRLALIGALRCMQKKGSKRRYRNWRLYHLLKKCVHIDSDNYKSKKTYFPEKFQKMDGHAEFHPYNSELLFAEGSVASFKNKELVIDKNVHAISCNKMPRNRITNTDIVEAVPSDKFPGLLEIRVNEKYVDFDDTKSDFFSFYKTYVTEKEYNESTDADELNVVSIVDPSFLGAFKKVCISIPFCYQSELHHVLNAGGNVEFADKFPGTDMTHPNSQHISIHYFTDREWSNSLKDRRGLNYRKKDEDDISPIDGFGRDCPRNIEWIYYWLRNNAKEDFVYNVNPEDEKMFDITSLGRNRKAAVCLSADNLSNLAIPVLEKMNIDINKINFSRNTISAYIFCCMNTNAHKDNNRGHIDYYVSDKQTAIFFKEVFPLATIQKVEDKLYLNETPRSVERLHETEHLCRNTVQPIYDNGKKFTEKQRKKIISELDYCVVYNN